MKNKGFVTVKAWCLVRWQGVFTSHCSSQIKELCFNKEGSVHYFDTFKLVDFCIYTVN